MWATLHRGAGQVCAVAAARMRHIHGVSLGVVPTHIGFADGLAPDDAGRLPRDSHGILCAVAEMQLFCPGPGQNPRASGKAPAAAGPAVPTAVQIPYFAAANQDDVAELVAGLREDCGLDVHFIAMVGGVDPMAAADEDAVVEQLVPSLEACIRHSVSEVSSTSIEAWMAPDAKRKDGAALEAAVEQNINVHLRAYAEAGLAGSCVQNWHIEFLRCEKHNYASVDTMTW